MPPRLSALRDPVALVVGALAVHRLTRLVTADEVTAPLRDRLAGQDDGHGPERPRAAYFIHCPWCVSAWIGAGWAALTVAAPTAATAAGAALAWSSVTGLLSSWE